LQRPRELKSENEAASNAESRLAVGALVGFYRRTRQPNWTQKELADAAGLKASALGMFESGQRLPSPEVAERIGQALGLDAFERQQLQFICSYGPRGPIIGEQWFLPDDVLNGTPIFLRDPRREAQVQREAEISEMWIVTSKPMARDGAMYEMLKARILDEKTRFVYFLDVLQGETRFKDLWKRLTGDVPDRMDRIADKLKCVLVPSSLTLYHYGICNPGQLAKMFGRLIVYASGVPVGFLSMDTQQVLRAFEMLEPIYQKLEKQDRIETDYGVFRKITQTELSAL